LVGPRGSFQRSRFEKRVLQVLHKIKLDGYLRYKTAIFPEFKTNSTGSSLPNLSLIPYIFWELGGCAAIEVQPS
jgi:hypothetical protein